MADEAENPTPTTLYLSAAPTSNGNISGEALQQMPAHHSLYQLQINPNNPNEGVLLPAPGADAMLTANDAALSPAYRLNGLPKPGQDFLDVEQPTRVEKIGDNWKVAEMGSVKFSAQQKPALNVYEEVTQAPAGPQILYLNGLPSLNGNVPANQLTYSQAAYSLLQLAIDPANPNRAEAVLAPGADEQMIRDYRNVVNPLFNTNSIPQEGERFIHVEKPAIFERTGETWKLAEQGQANYSDKPQLAPDQSRQQEQAQLTTRAAELASEVATTTGPARAAAEAELEGVANRAELGPDAGKAAYADGLRDEAAAKLGAGDQQPAKEEKTVPEQNPTPAQESNAGELQIKWKQQGDAVAPLLEMRAYIDQLKDSGVAVGPMKFQKDADGKLSGSFGVSYDPESPELTKLEGTIQGLKRVGNGVEVVEKPEQVVARRQSMGVEGQDKATDLGYSVKEAFGVKQWDALSAQLSQAPKQALTGPEQAQQAAGVERVQQVAKQQGKTSEQVIQDGKSLLEIDTSGNPVSAFLKNFYDHLNGAPKTRQNLEVDYDKTRQDLQARLVKMAGNADPTAPKQKASDTEGVTPIAAAATVVASVAPQAPAPAATVAPAQQVAAPAPAPKFTEADIPQKVLATMGLTIADLSANGQLQKLLNGEKTGLLAMQAAGKEGQEAVKFDAKMVLHREADGSATLKMELPKKQLEIPNEIGGQPFTPEQRKQLETEGTAGLIRGLKDKEGNTYNGYVGVDKEMNKVVVLPENKVTFKDEIAGVKLSPEQSHDLREGKAVHVAQMNRPDGGQPFDGTVQIHAAKAGVEVKPEPYELAKTQAPAATQTRDLDSDKKQAPIQAPKVTVTEVVETARPKVRGPRI